MGVVRDIEAGDFFELLLVFAIVTILSIRGFLALTGYPQVGGDSLHIAHMLWGGLGMLVALGLLLTFWNPGIRRLAACIGGIGFGTFIDELGKFITQDNDYFFQPTVALLYVLFVLLFLAGMAYRRYRPLTPEEIEANERLREVIEPEEREGPLIAVYDRARRAVGALYHRLVGYRWFPRALAGLFLAVGLIGFAGVVGLTDWRNPRDTSGIEAGSSMLTLAFVWIGIWRLRRDRLAAYRWFLRGILVGLLVTQVFVFYHDQFAALGGLVVDLSLYAVLRLLIEQESQLREPGAEHL
jgi:hypothetical protein